MDIQNKDLTEDGDYFINSGITNCGIKGKVTRKAKLFPENTLTVDFFGNTYYRDFKYKLATHNHVFSLSSSALKNRAVGLYISSAFSYLTKKYSFNTMLTRPQMNEECIILPTINNELAFDYMQDYVRELEQDYVRELDAYLKATGLDNYELTEEENKIIQNPINFTKYKIADFFKVEGTTSLDAGKLTFKDEGINFIGRISENNGCQGKISKQSFEPNSEKTITATVIGNYKYVKFQEEPYYCSQNINKLTPLFDGINAINSLFFITSIKKIC